jgi:hypothetical protein
VAEKKVHRENVCEKAGKEARLSLPRDKKRHSEKGGTRK